LSGASLAAPEVTSDSSITLRSTTASVPPRPSAAGARDRDRARARCH
jgi:hypothetical protein